MKYDVLIKNGIVVDGAGAPPFEADVGLKDGRIAAVGALAEAEAGTIIDAAGGAVSPGFIDMHSHADMSLPLLSTAESLVHQGITTAVVGQCGLTLAPMSEAMRGQLGAMIASILGQAARSMPWGEWSSVADYLTFLEREGVSPNVFPLVGQGNIRAAAMGFAPGRADEKQAAQMRAAVAEAMTAGARGLSTGLIYPPGSFTATEELIDLVKVVGQRGGVYFTHIRGEGETLLEAVAEAIRIGRESGAPVQISHFKAGRRANWSKSAPALALIDQARAEGLDVSADMYPYLAGSTTLATFLPDWAHQGGPATTLKLLADPQARRRMKADMAAGGFAKGVAWSEVMITSSPRRPEYEGRFVSALALEAGQSGPEWVFDALLETELGLSMAAFLMSEENRRREITHPHMMIGTDGLGLAAQGPLAKGKPHPRNFGTFARVLGHYVREEKVLSLTEAVHKMTGLAAQKLRLSDRGLIKPGLAADVVVFDPHKVADVATYEEPHRYPSGIDHVIINGRSVVMNGVHTGARPGLVLRRG